MTLFTNRNIKVFFCIAIACLIGVAKYCGAATIAGNVIALWVLFVGMMVLERGVRREKKEEAEKIRFSVLVQNSSDLIAISDVDRVLQYINPIGRDMVGLARDKSLKGVTGDMFYSPEYNQRMQDEVIPGVIKNGNWSGEFCYQNFLTKESIPVLLNVFPLYDPKTNKRLGMAVVARDIRDRKILQKQLDRFFEVSLDMLGIANVQGRFIKLNPAFTEILGYTEAELCSRPAVDFIHPDDVQSTMDQIAAQAGGKSVLSFENRYRTKNGDYRWFSWKSSPDGELTYGAARDITDEKNQQILMKKLSQDAIAASLAKSEFLANMSHEIRTPINGVVGMTTLLLDSPLNTQQLEYAENIRTSAESLLTVINDILDFSKIEAGKLDIEKVDFSLDHLIDETAKSMSWAVKNKSLPFVVSFDRGTKHLFRGDPGRIRQILTNLISNAVKFTEIGSIHLEVARTKNLGTASEFQFTIKDTGIGLSDSAQKKLFQAFTQADASTTRKFGGTGLGLSISKRLVELMGGQIGVESVEGQGAKFWFTLTLDHSAEKSSMPKKAAALIKTQFPNAQILLAEDNFINQKILLAMLDKIGFKAQAVANGNEVLSILRERPFDLILMDCQMPELDGYDATRKIRESSSLPNVHIPIIAMTANALKGDKEKCLAAGMDDYASKPIKLEDLSLIIEKWLSLAEQKKKVG